MRLLQKFILAAFLPLTLFSQSVDTLLIKADTIASRTVNFNEDWRYHPGDDSTWSDPLFDDSKWEVVDCRLNLDDSLKVDWEGIGWFRKTINIDSTLTNRNVALLVSQFGASQIYLNGRIVKELGTISTLADSEKIYNPRRIPFYIDLDTNQIYTLAVRYSNQIFIKEPRWYKKYFDRIGFSIGITNSNRSSKNTVFNEGLTYAVNVGISGIFFTLSLLYFLLYLFYQRKKENLYYALFTFFLGIVFLFSVGIRFVTESLVVEASFQIVNTIALSLSFVSYLGFLYSIFYDRIPKQFYIILTLSIVITVLTFTTLPVEIEDYLLVAVIVLAVLEGIRVIILAIKRKEQNSWIIGTGVIINGLFFLSIIVISLFTSNINSIIGAIFFFFGLLSLPLSMSIYLARNIADTNRNLEKQIETVKELSAREIENQKKTAELEIAAERERAENERKTKELEEARQLQLSMLPKELPDDPRFDIAVSMNTATEVGGDYYDFHLSKDGILTAVIGDATGHGLMAGTMVTATKSLFNSFNDNSDIIGTMNSMSSALKNMNFRLLSMCFCMLKINDDIMELSSAGMPPVLIHRGESNILEELFLRGMPLGSATAYKYELKEVTVSSGDTIFLCSDGFPELFNPKKEMLGYEKVKEIFLNHAANDAQTIIDHMNIVVTEYSDGAEIEDDITFVVLKVK